MIIFPLSFISITRHIILNVNDRGRRWYVILIKMFEITFTVE